MADDLSTYWQDLPSKETPLDAATLNAWGALVETRAAAAEAAAMSAELTEANIGGNIASWATSTPNITAALPWLAIWTSYTPVEEKLDDWWAAVATGTAQAVVIGDSISEGAGSSVVGNRWQSLVQGALRRQRGVSTGAAFPFIPGYPATATGWPVARAGSVVANGSWGMGWRTAVLQDASASLTFTFTGTQAKVMYTKATGTGVMQIVVDGGTPVVVNTNSAAGGTSNAALWDTGALSRGDHTVTITRDASSGSGQHPYIQGLLTWDGDTTTGIRVLDAAHSGYASTSLSTGASGRVTTAAQAIAAAGGAQLAIIALGTNDTIGPTPAATYRANIEAMIAALRANGFTGSIALLHFYKGSGLSEEVYSGFGAQLAAIAAGDPKVAFFDMRRRMPDIPTPYTDVKGLGLFADSLHPSDAGHQWIARVLTDYLTPRA